MIELQKILVYLVTTMLLFYMAKLLIFTKKRWKFRTYTFIILIGGLSLINIATFVDMISYFKDSHLAYMIIKISFTLGAIIYVLGVILWSDYTKKTIEKFEELALTDPMTGMLNRKGIENSYRIVSENGNCFYVILCDLDGTKRVNDDYGHIYGDKYINSTTKIITDSIGLKGKAARIGGDEFVILLSYVDIEELQQIISKIKSSVSEIIPEKNTGISCGYSLFPDDGIIFEELIKVADKRMYEDKKTKECRE
ncbi:GGDEF domain-containing protein [Clostridium scatologenes]|uniref:Diguanylate cyclase n=1 Tax=Clostridium scatologenes TaxID=1548 RepID=A0A0E3M5X5_CLOSL|nr:GGDEF domain-containing protein [Clostridium scatologenes]AKA68665.1 diguanylate cyclase [Clostridium scatologenes]